MGCITYPVCVYVCIIIMAYLILVTVVLANAGLIYDVAGLSAADKVVEEAM